MLTNRLFSIAEFPPRALRLTAAWIVFASAIAFAESPALQAAASLPSSATNAATSPAPSFDAATIKPYTGPIPIGGVSSTADRVDASAATLPVLVEYAYGLRSADQVSGVPNWAKSGQFDLTAKIGEADMAAMAKLNPAEKQARRQKMMQVLLAQRFQLKVHSETRQVPVYDLAIAKGGSKLTDAATDTNDHLLRGTDGKPLHGFLSWSTGKVIAQGFPAKNFADFLSKPMCGLGRPVIDKTGLTGTYNFTLDWSPQFPGVRFGPESGSAATEDAPSIFTALKDVGLDLRPSTGSIETIVIDHAEQPTAN